MPEESLNMPKSKYIEAKKAESSKKISDAFEEYKALLRDTTHPDNQTLSYDKRVASTLQRLLTAADELDSVSPGEGIFGLIVLSLRSILKLKDDNVKLQSEIKDLKIKLSSSDRRGKATVNKK